MMYCSIRVIEAMAMQSFVKICRISSSSQGITITLIDLRSCIG